jgi:hypothetical protein
MFQWANKSHIHTATIFGNVVNVIFNLVTEISNKVIAWHPSAISAQTSLERSLLKATE